MPRKAKVKAVSLSDKTRSTLSELARSRTAPAHHVERSPSSCTWQISAAPARRPRRSASTASGSRAVPVAAAGPLKAIDDLPRSGRQPELTEASWLIGEAWDQPKDRGYPHELWTLRQL